MYILAQKNDSVTINGFGKSKNVIIKIVDSMDTKVSIDIWNDKVIVSSFGEKDATCILIENLFLAEGYRAIFKKLWSLASNI